MNHFMVILVSLDRMRTIVWGSVHFCSAVQTSCQLALETTMMFDLLNVKLIHAFNPR